MNINVNFFHCLLAFLDLMVLKTVAIETESLLVLLGQMRLLHVLDGFRFRAV